MRWVQRWLSLVLLGLLSVSSAHAEISPISGQSYELFSKYYKENVSFINNNDNRHLLPLVLAKRGDILGDGRLAYELIGDTLAVTILTDPTGLIIEQCTITLTAPSSMEYGSALYNDFAISGYHSYALLMAMHADSDPVRRYELVTAVVSGMSENNGTYTRQIGVYTIECTRDQNVATLSFQNNRALATPGPDTAPETETSPPSIDEDEDAGLL